MSYPERTKVTPKSSENTSARVSSFLRKVRPLKTAEAVSFETGIPATTVKSWLRGIAKPSFDATLTMVVIYGPDFLAAVMPYHLGWLDTAARQARTTELTAEQERIERELKELRRC